MLYAARFAASVAIAAWGLLMLVLGMVNATFLWVVLGIAIMAVGSPLLASHPWLTPRLYPVRGAIDPADGGRK
jgi:hypothetical protein